MSPTRVVIRFLRSDFNADLETLGSMSRSEEAAVSLKMSETLRGSMRARCRREALATTRVVI